MSRLGSVTEPAPLGKARQGGPGTKAQWVLEYAARLGPDVLLLAGYSNATDATDATTAVAEYRIEGRRRRAQAQVFSFERPDLVDLGAGAGRLYVVPAPGAAAVDSVRVRTAGSRAFGEEYALASALVDLRTLLLHSGAAALGCEQRQALMASLCEAASIGADPGPRGETAAGAGAERSASLFDAREVLRERLGTSHLVAGEPLALSVEVVAAIDERCFWVEGWLATNDNLPRRLTAVSPEGERVELFDTLFRHPRPDVASFVGAEQGDGGGHGFVATFEVRTPSVRADGWVFELETFDGQQCEVNAPPTLGDAHHVQDHVARKLALEGPSGDALRRTHIGPALGRLLARRERELAISSVEQHGIPPHAPRVSVVVPLYRRIDFVEHQLAQFAHDPDMAGVDLIYVLDSPEIADQFRRACRALQRLYDVPFRSAVLSANAGFALANNLGVSLAKGRLLVLLNSDVIPAGPGWVGTMSSFYERTKTIGALGARLLYEDDALQHAGMYFARPEGEDLWTNEHYFKGLHATFPPANIARSVPAVTAACLMISTALYRRVGGLRGTFVRGDYEDSDLCLRLAEEGYENWYLPEAVLYHLEGQSYPSQERANNALYNRWLQTVWWNDRIEAVMGACPELSPDGTGAAPVLSRQRSVTLDRSQIAGAASRRRTSRARETGLVPGRATR